MVIIAGGGYTTCACAGMKGKMDAGVSPPLERGSFPHLDEGMSDFWHANQTILYNNIMLLAVAERVFAAKMDEKIIENIRG